MPISWSRLCPLAGAGAVALFTAALLLLSDAPSDATARLAIGLTALVLAVLLVHAVLAELGRRRTDARLDALARNAHRDRIYSQEVLQDISRKMDDLSALELTQVRILREMNDTGGFPIRTP